MRPFWAVMGGCAALFAVLIPTNGQVPIWVPAFIIGWMFYEVFIRKPSA